MIEKYSFGQMTIEGNIYRSDLIIYPDGTVQDNWRRNKGDLLTEGDLKNLIDSQPELIIAGTGAYGIMKLDKDISNSLKNKGIELKAIPSKKAMELYNFLFEQKKIGACFHLTC